MDLDRQGLVRSEEEVKKDRMQMGERGKGEGEGRGFTGRDGRDDAHIHNASKDRSFIQLSHND